MGAPSLFMLSGAPQDERHALGHAVAVGREPGEQLVGAPAPLEHRRGARHAVGVEAVQVAAGGQHGRGAQQVAAGRGLHVPRVERAKHAGRLVVGAGEQGVEPRELVEQGGRGRGVVAGAGEHGVGGPAPAVHVDERLDRGPRDVGGGAARVLVARCAREQFGDGRQLQLGPPRLRHGQERVDAGRRRHRLAHGVQPHRDQRLLHLQQPRAQRVGARGRLARRPRRPRRAQLRGRPLRLHAGRESGAVRVGRAAVAVERRLELLQPAVQPGVRDRRRQVRHERRRAASLGQRPLARVVARVQVDVGQRADEPLRPAVARQPDLLAGHELERPVRAEVQHRVGREVLLEPAVERAEGVRGREVPLEEEPHRVALPPERRLHAHEHVAELRAHHEQRLPVGELLAGRRAPRALDLASHGSRATCRSALTRACTLAGAPKRSRLPSHTIARSASTLAGSSTVYPCSASARACAAATGRR
jgi:hypothetical protein